MPDMFLPLIRIAYVDYYLPAAVTYEYNVNIVERSRLRTILTLQIICRKQTDLLFTWLQFST